LQQPALHGDDLPCLTQRGGLQKYRFFTVYVTVMVALTVVLIHLVPDLFPQAVTLYITWSP
jgi:hypothetical protein